MLDIMRRKKRLKIILWLVIISLGLGMLLLFVPGANVSSVTFDTTAATVDGESILMKDLLETYQQQLNSLSDGGRNKLDRETIKSLGLGRQVLEGLISNQVVHIVAKRVGIDVTLDEIREAVESHPAFQEEGKFVGLELYKAVLNANNLSVMQFEESLRDMLLSTKLRNVITDSLSVSDRELREEFARTTQEAQVDFVVLKADDFKNRVKPVEADLKAYFEEHKEKYYTKEKRRAQYLLVPIAPLLPDISVSEEEIQQEWNQTPHEETVDASHILFGIEDPTQDAEIKAKAEAVLKRARSGEDFAELAKEFSDDSGSASRGGNLGAFPRGSMVKPFEEAAFSLKPGEISDLVKTDYGYHIIKVLQHHTPTLESSRNSLENSIQYRKANELAKQKAGEAARLAEKQKDLNLIAEALNIQAEIKETDLFTREDDPFKIGISMDLRDDIFELKEINSTGSVADHPLGFAVPKLIEVVLPKPPDFEESRNLVENDYVASKAEELLQADAKKLSQEAAKLQNLQKAGQQMGFTVKSSQPFKSNESADPEIGTNQAFISASFDLPPGDVSEVIPLGNRLAVLQVKSRTPFDEEAFEKQRVELRELMLQSMQDLYFQEYIRQVKEDLEKAGKIKINPKALEQLSLAW